MLPVNFSNITLFTDYYGEEDVEAAPTRSQPAVQPPPRPARPGPPPSRPPMPVQNVIPDSSGIITPPESPETVGSQVSVS